MFLTTSNKLKHKTRTTYLIVLENKCFSDQPIFSHKVESKTLKCISQIHSHQSNFVMKLPFYWCWDRFAVVNVGQGVMRIIKITYAYICWYLIFELDLNPCGHGGWGRWSIISLKTRKLITLRLTRSLPVI